MGGSRGSLAAWDDEDFYHEMQDQREAISDSRTTSEEVVQIVQTAGLLVLCASDAVQSMAEAHHHEMNMRYNLMLGAGMDLILE